VEEIVPRTPDSHDGRKASPIKAQRRNLSDAVTDTMLGWLREGRYTVGSRLPTERELMDQFEVGRNTIREAVQALATLGAVEVRPGRGMTVLSTNPSNVLDLDVVAALLDGTTLDDLYEFRLTLETDVAYKAAARADDDDIATAEKALARYEEALNAKQPVYQADIDFHRTLAIATRNPIYVRIHDALSDLIINARKATDQVPAATQRAMHEHRAILKAIADHDADEARRLMAIHINSATWALQTARTKLRENKASDKD
jgi:GntR family transcriptional repressor for pyruvate dehydrogenase complex